MQNKCFAKASALTAIAIFSGTLSGCLSEEGLSLQEDSSSSSDLPWMPENFRYIKERSPVDRPDDVPGKEQIHVIYVLPSDGEDESLDVLGIIAFSAESFQRWLENETGGRRLRFDTQGGSLDISFYRLSETKQEIADNGVNTLNVVARELRAAGFNATNKIYAAYYSGWGPACGNGSPNEGAIVYLKSCGSTFASQLEHPASWEFMMLHEIFHALGAVPECAPHRTSVHAHVSDSASDIMYEGEGGAGPGVRRVLDFGRDDYYGHGREDCLDLARSSFLHSQGSTART